MLMYSHLNELKQYLSEAHRQIDYLALKYVQRHSQNLRIVNERPEEIKNEFDCGFRLEVFYDGHFGYACTSDTSAQGFQRCLDKAIRMTKKLSCNKIYPFSLKTRPKIVGSYKSQIQRSFDSLTLQEIQKILRDCTLEMKIHDSIFNRLAEAKLSHLEEYTIDSLGTEIGQSFHLINLDLVARGISGNEIQSRTSNMCLQIGSEAFLKNHLLPLSKKLAEQTLELLSANNCPKGKFDVILAPDQMYMQIHETVGHPLEMDRILGDERNFAGSSFVKVSDFGNLQYGSEKMNITFEPGRFSEVASYSYDDSHLKAEKIHLIKNGLLTRGLGGLESFERSQISPVANFRSSSWNRAPIDRMANLNLEPGETPLETLISKVENGMIMLTNRTWSIDDFRDKFQFGCEFAQVIRNGKLQEVVKNPNYHGRSLEFWNQLVDVSIENETHGTHNCGKGEPSQVIHVGHSSPFALFKNVEVF